MSQLLGLKKDHKAALDRAEALIAAAESNNRPLTASEDEQVNAAMAEAQELMPQITAIERKSTILSMRGGGLAAFMDMGRPDPSSAFAQQPAALRRSADTQRPEYTAALHSFFKTGGKAHGEELNAGADGTGGFYFPGSEAFTAQRGPNGRPFAATYEGTGGNSNGAGGYAVSIPTTPQIVPLALPDLGLYDASMVVPTATDLKIPQAASFGTSALKAESGASIATFGGSDPTLGQIELSAFMIGALRLASWELLQDVSTFQQFLVDDLLKGQRIYEGTLLATGSGTGQPQGVFGNTGTGTGSAYALAGTSADSATLLGALFDVVATLKGAYQANASWVLTRATGLAIRRAQMAANLYAPVITTDADGVERILGKPVFYDVNAPALPSATTAGVTPILYGDFKAGNLIGVRGGEGISVKILDQPYAANGQLGILAYRRLDSRVRRSEAIQQIKFSHS